jgi:hypothetical protein
MTKIADFFMNNSSGQLDYLRILELANSRLKSNIQIDEIDMTCSFLITDQQKPDFPVLPSNLDSFCQSIIHNVFLSHKD